MTRSEPPKPSVLGPYRLIERIAVGGMAEVYRAARPAKVGEERAVVLKRMLPRLASDPSARAMFEEEARLGSQIRHPNVVKVLDYGPGADGSPYLALEYVHGVDLWRLMRWLTREGKGLSVSQVVFLAREMLAGLHAVHEAVDEAGNRLGVVHRDVSPSNVLLSVHGDAKLGDLGIARSRLRERYPNAGLSERAKGKLGYLAPEQVRGVESDRRADIFSAGVICAEMLMGRPLFSGGSELAVLLAIRDSKVHPFLEFAIGLPAGLGDLVVEALAQKAVRRPATAELFAARLLPFQVEPVDVLREEIASLVIQAMAGGPHGLPVQQTPTRTMTNPEALFGQTEAATPVQPINPLAETLDPGTPSAGPWYRVRTAGGKSHGPWTFAQMVQAIAMGRLGPADLVRKDEGDAQALHEIPQLARHLPSSSSTTNSIATDAGHLRMSGEVLPLDDGAIVLALTRAALERTTALLLFELGGIRKEVYLKDGVPAFVTSNLSGELLGEYLVSRGVITQGELDMALAVMPRFEGRLGDTLSALGLVEPVVLFQHIAEQVREKLLELFLWTSGSCTHYHGVAPPPSGFPLNLDAWDILDEGIRRRMLAGLEEVRVEQLRRRRLRISPRANLTALRPSVPLRLRRVLTELEVPLRGLELMLLIDDPDEPERPLRDALLLLTMEALELVD